MSQPFVRPDVRGFLAYLNTMPGPHTHRTMPEAAQVPAQAASR